jgi:MSHA biogenesis protein MshO
MRTRGFTLVEMTVALVVGAIVAGFIAMFIATPVNAYLAQNRRTELSESAESAMRMLSQDIGNALPNSVRTVPVGSRRIVEMIPIQDQSRYRSVGADFLDFSIVDPAFDVFGPLTIGPQSRIVIGSRTAGAQSVYGVGTRAITANGAAFNAPLNRVTLPGAGFQFGTPSIGQRVYVVESVTQYQCDLANGTLTRFTGLAITPNIVPAVAGGTLVARNVTACTFGFTPAALLTPTNGGLLRIQMQISRVTEGVTDQMRIAQQIRVRNPP